jgi:hypothetical protein
MILSDRVNAFVNLGEYILSTQSNTENNEFWQTVNAAYTQNQWFTPEFCKFSIVSIAQEWLNTESLNKWINGYPASNFNPTNHKNIGVVLAGNVPFVGFHDMLCTLIAGHKFIGKTSSKDGGLIQAVVKVLTEIEPRFQSYINITESKLENFDAVIATGSNNSARYFDFYFGKYPNIIRKNRHSIAILTGDESSDDLSKLGSDIFTYFGLGCRNVSKILVPQNYNFNTLLSSLENYQDLSNHNKYANNYQYHRAIYLMNSIEHLDNGFLLVKPDDTLGSPVGVLFYQYYTDIDSALNYVSQNIDSIQCLVANDRQISNSIGFGIAQNPSLNDYADGIDTIAFLASL